MSACERIVLSTWSASVADLDWTTKVVLPSMEAENSPVSQASSYKDHGFKNLHIVDLDGALAGRVVNLDIIQEIVKKSNLKVEIGGGIRNFESVQKYLDVGVEKVILGSAAIKDKNFLKDACLKFPEKIALGLDAKKWETLELNRCKN